MLDRARDKLEKELQTLKKELYQEIPKEIQKALQMGDLRENAEYKAALERQQYVQSRMGQLHAQLKTLSMVDLKQLPRDRAALGSKLKLYEPKSEREVSYELVMPEEADLSKGLVSVSSPIGRALLGHREGDEVTIKIPAGTRVYEILSLETLHDRGEG